MSIYPFLEEGHAVIKTWLENYNVLVHCQMGISRSSSLVIAFLMKEFGMSLKEARKLVQSKRQIIQPNPSFVKDLERFEEYLKGSKAKEALEE